MMQPDRITRQPNEMGGRACIRGTRITVGMVVGQIEAGHIWREGGARDAHSLLP